MKEKRAMLKSLIIFMIVFSFTFEMVAAGSCHDQKWALLNACKMLMIRQSPSAECCFRIRTAQMWCVCPSVTPQRAALVDVNYAVGVIRQCGRHVTSGTKCGSLTAP